MSVMTTCLNHPDRAARARGLCGSCYATWRYRNVPACREARRARSKAYTVREQAKVREQARLRSARYRASHKEERAAYGRKYWFEVRKARRRAQSWSGVPRDHLAAKRRVAVKVAPARPIPTVLVGKPVLVDHDWWKPAVRPRWW